jgi:predicted dehydrogenase
MLRGVVNDFGNFGRLGKAHSSTWRCMGMHVRAALIGAGLVGQVAHLHTMTRPESPIVLAGVIDASARRAKNIGDRFQVPSATDLAELSVAELDAVVISAPDPAHRSLTLQALELGLHVFIEKPLGLSAHEAQEMTLAAQSSGRTCQVGYMKRFDPAVETLQNLVNEPGIRVDAVAVEVRDPDASPFVRNFPFVNAGVDVPTRLLAEGQARLADTVAGLLGQRPTMPQITGYTSYISSLIHDLNLVRLLMPDATRITDAFIAMDGGQVGMRLATPDGRVARICHTQQPYVADYEERLTVYSSQGTFELVFPAPYLLYQPTVLRHIHLKDADEVSVTEELNSSTAEAFVRELESFAHVILTGGIEPVQNSFADATVDLELIDLAYRMAVS